MGGALFVCHASQAQLPLGTGYADCQGVAMPSNNVHLGSLVCCAVVAGWDAALAVPELNGLTGHEAFERVLA